MDQRHSPLFLGIAAVAILSELVWRLRTGRGYDGAAAMTTLGLVAGHLVITTISGAALRSIFGMAWAAASHRFTTEAWQSWALAFIALDFAYYWFHRASHEIRWLWASHNVHHSTEQLTFLASLRLGWTNLLSLGWLFYLPLIALGFEPRIVTTLLAVNLNYQFFLHSEAIPKLGPLEWILNTPNHHRAHHACNPEYLDRNYGGALIVWDRLFGTLASDSGMPRHYGLVGRARESDPIRLVFHEWRAILRDLHTVRDWRGWLGVVTRMPSHLGS